VLLDGAWHKNLIDVGLRGLIVSKSSAEKAGNIPENVAKEGDKGLVEWRSHSEKKQYLHC